MNISVVFLCVSLFFGSAAMAETLYLKSGKVMNIRIIEKTDEYVSVNVDGIPIKYYLDEIEKIEDSPSNIRQPVAKPPRREPVKQAGRERPVDMFVSRVNASYYDPSRKGLKSFKCEALVNGKLFKTAGGEDLKLILRYYKGRFKFYPVSKSGKSVVMDKVTLKRFEDIRHELLGFFQDFYNVGPVLGENQQYMMEQGAQTDTLSFHKGPETFTLSFGKNLYCSRIAIRSSSDRETTVLPEWNARGDGFLLAGYRILQAEQAVLSVGIDYQEGGGFFLPRQVRFDYGPDSPEKSITIDLNAYNIVRKPA